MTTPQLPDTIGFKSALEALKVSVLRTVVPLLVSLIVTGLARLGITLDSATAETLVTAALGFVGGLVYYVVVRWLETAKSSKWGKLLGAAHAPVYTDPSSAAKVVEGEDAVVPPALAEKAEEDPLKTEV